MGRKPNEILQFKWEKAYGIKIQTKINFRIHANKGSKTIKIIKESKNRKEINARKNYISFSLHKNKQEILMHYDNKEILAKQTCL